MFFIVRGLQVIVFILFTILVSNSVYASGSTLSSRRPEETRDGVFLVVDSSKYQLRDGETIASLITDYHQARERVNYVVSYIQQDHVESPISHPRDLRHVMEDFFEIDPVQLAGLLMSRPNSEILSTFSRIMFITDLFVGSMEHCLPSQFILIKKGLSTLIKDSLLGLKENRFCAGNIFGGIRNLGYLCVKNTTIPIEEFINVSAWLAETMPYSICEEYFVKNTVDFLTYLDKARFLKTFFSDGEKDQVDVMLEGTTLVKNNKRVEAETGIVKKFYAAALCLDSLTLSVGPNSEKAKEEKAILFQNMDRLISHYETKMEDLVGKRIAFESHEDDWKKQFVLKCHAALNPSLTPEEVEKYVKPTHDDSLFYQFDWQSYAAGLNMPKKQIPATLKSLQTKMSRAYVLRDSKTFLEDLQKAKDLSGLNAELIVFARSLNADGSGSLTMEEQLRLIEEDDNDTPKKGSKKSKAAQGKSKPQPKPRPKSQAKTVPEDFKEDESEEDGAFLKSYMPSERAIPLTQDERHSAFVRSALGAQITPAPKKSDRQMARLVQKNVERTEAALGVAPALSSPEVIGHRSAPERHKTSAFYECVYNIRANATPLNVEVIKGVNALSAAFISALQIHNIYAFQNPTGNGKDAVAFKVNGIANVVFLDPVHGSQQEKGAATGWGLRLKEKLQKAGLLLQPSEVAGR